MQRINISELKSISNKKNENKLKLYNKLIIKCHDKIKESAKNQHSSCIYEIPKYTFGYPLYDFDELQKYIINSLKKDGLKVENVLNILYISWGDDTKNKSKNKNKKNDNINYRPIEDYNPTGNILYDNNSLKSIEDKSIKFLNV